MQRLLCYCQKENWKGFDPYDGLKCPWLKFLPPGGKLLRILLIQFCKRSFLNFRKLLLIKKEYNPKALGLFLSAMAKLYQVSGDERCKYLCYQFIHLLLKNKNRGYSGACWGYNFDWQSKAFFLPKFTPTVVATSFIANAFLDAYQILREEEFLKIARSSCDFVLNDLNRTYQKKSFCLSYSPLDRTVIYNANFLGAHLLTRVAHITGEEELKRIASRSVEFVIDHQNPDGSWYYGERPHHRWIDNFHTGFMLDCLFDCINLSSRFDLLSNLESGIKFYLDNFFLSDGIPKYYHNRVFPIDIHGCAQSIITLTKLSSFSHKAVELKEKIVCWTLSNMQDPRGYFYFQKKHFFTNKIAYMRWSQAWMLKALAFVLADQSETSRKISGVEREVLTTS